MTTPTTFPWKKILVPVDFSENARKALGSALALARSADAHVTLVHVAEPCTFEAYGFVGIPDLNTQLEENAGRKLAEWTATNVPGDCSVATAVATGRPSDEIVRLAKDGGFDMILISTHGHTGVAHLLLGSVAERIVRHAPCPVLVERGD